MARRFDNTVAADGMYLEELVVPGRQVIRSAWA